MIRNATISLVFNHTLKPPNYISPEDAYTYNHFGTELHSFSIVTSDEFDKAGFCILAHRVNKVKRYGGPCMLRSSVRKRGR